VEVVRVAGDGGATGNDPAASGDRVPVVLEGAGRPRLASGAGVHSLLGG